MSKITPTLWYDGTAEEAANFYVSLLPDSRIEAVNRSPIDTPSGPAGMVLTVVFALAGQLFCGLNGGPQFPHSEAVSFMIETEDQAETDRLCGPRSPRMGANSVPAAGSRTGGAFPGKSRRSGCSNCSPIRIAAAPSGQCGR